MKTLHAGQAGSHAAPKKAKYPFLAAIALIAALIGGAFLASPRALAQDVQDRDLSFGLQSGLVTAHLDKSGLPSGISGSGLPFSLQSGLATAHLDSSGRLAAGQGLAFGLQSGLATAHLDQSGRLAAGKGLPFGLQSGLVTAHLEKLVAAGSVHSEAVARSADLGPAVAAAYAVAGMGTFGAAPQASSFDADTARWVAMGEAYASKLARSTAAEAARWAAKGVYYTEGLLASSPELKYSRSFGPAVSSADGPLAANPELKYSRSFGLAVGGAVVSGQYTDVSKFYAERMRARAKAESIAGLGAGSAACSLTADESKLSSNPELVYSAQFQGC